MLSKHELSFLFRNSRSKLPLALVEWRAFLGLGWPFGIALGRGIGKKLLLLGGVLIDGHGGVGRILVANYPVQHKHDKRPRQQTGDADGKRHQPCLLYTSPSPR